MPVPPNRQVLLVEDNPADVDLVMVALREHQVCCELLVINNGERAVSLLDQIDAGQHPCPSLFIIDLNLPRRPGTEVLRRIRASQAFAHVPVVVLTSSDDDRDKLAVAQFSPSRYLQKPLTLEAFLVLGRIFSELLNLKS